MEKQSPFYAFYYMFRDNKFWTKYGVMFILTFLCLIQNLISGSKDTFTNMFVIGIAAIISIVTNFFYYGYLAAGVKSLIEQREFYVLPFFNFKNHGIIGLKFFVATAMFSAVILVVFIILSILCAILYLIHPSLGIISEIIVLSALILLMFVYGMAFFRMFAVTQDIFAFFKIAEICKSVRQNFNNYLKYLLIQSLLVIPMILAAVVGFTLFIIPAIINPYIATLILVIFISAIGAYSNMCFMYICAKCIE